MTVPAAAVPRVRPVGARRAWLVVALVVAVLLLVGSVAGTAAWLARHGGGLGAFPGGPGISSGEGWPDRRPGPDRPPGDIHERMRDWMRGDRP